jgi:hypothetical protein
VYQVLDRFFGWFGVVVNLLLGLVWTWKAIEGIVREKRFTGTTIVLLSAGVSLIAVGLLHSLGIVGQPWLLPSIFMAWGLLDFLGGSGIISVTVVTAGVRKGLAVTFGVIAMLGSAFMALGILLSSH